MTALLILFAAFFTAALSAVFGMAGGLVLMGVLALLLPVSAAMVTHGVLQSVSNGWRAFLLREWIMGRTLSIYLIGAAAAAGLLALLSVTLNTAWLLIVLGLTPLLVWVPARWFTFDVRRPVDAVLCGFAVTALNTIAGVAGPLLDVFFQTTPGDRHAIVATKAGTQVVAHAVKIVYYLAPALASGAAPAVWILLAATAASVAGTTLGARGLARLSDTAFRAWTKRLVSAIGAVYAAQGLWMLFGG